MFGQHDQATNSDSNGGATIAPSTPSAPSTPTTFGQNAQPTVANPGALAPHSAAPAPHPTTFASEPAMQASFAGSTLDTSVPSAPASVPAPAPPAPSAPPLAPIASVSAGPAAIHPHTSEDESQELLHMKHEAIAQLQPLIGSLEQAPEEEFRTLMMMIQATDDRSMLKNAMDVAKKIPDGKARAQAMLDVINEINYFTQSQE